jgi:predicted enzyme related to lactoylglutathione lyase
MLKIDKLTIAVTNIDSMGIFYSNLLDIKMEKIDLGDTFLLKGNTDNFELLLCPKAIAGIDATQNNIQLRFQVENLSQITTQCVESGGTIINEISESTEVNIGAVRDPDGNSIELIQKVKNENY